MNAIKQQNNTHKSIFPGFTMKTYTLEEFRICHKASIKEVNLSFILVHRGMEIHILF